MKKLKISGEEGSADPLRRGSGYSMVNVEFWRHANSVHDFLWKRRAACFWLIGVSRKGGKNSIGLLFWIYETSAMVVGGEERKAIRGKLANLQRKSGDIDQTLDCLFGTRANSNSRTCLVANLFESIARCPRGFRKHATSAWKFRGATQKNIGRCPKCFWFTFLGRKPKTQTFGLALGVFRTLSKTLMFLKVYKMVFGRSEAISAVESENLYVHHDQHSADSHKTCYRS